MNQCLCVEDKQIDEHSNNQLYRNERQEKGRNLLRQNKRKRFSHETASSLAFQNLQRNDNSLNDFSSANDKLLLSDCFVLSSHADVLINVLQSSEEHLVGIPRTNTRILHYISSGASDHNYYFSMVRDSTSSHRFNPPSLPPFPSSFIIPTPFLDLFAFTDSTEKWQFISMKFQNFRSLFKSEGPLQPSGR